MQLLVGGLAEETTEKELSELFSEFGPVESVTIVRDMKSGQSRCFGMVKISSSVKGEEAIKHLNKTMLGTRQIVVTRIPEMLPGEMELREWLSENALEVLGEVGVKKGQTVLDYGCGSGKLTIPSARIVGEEGKVYALDVSPGGLERVREKAANEGLGNIETVLADGSGFATGLPDEDVNVILVYDVMHDIDDKPGLLKELHRVLSRDGFLSIFPMHIGTDKMLEIMNECGLFCLRDSYVPPGHKTASEILNFNKC